MLEPNANGSDVDSCIPSGLPELLFQKIGPYTCIPMGAYTCIPMGAYTCIPMGACIAETPGAG